MDVRDEEFLKRLLSTFKIEAEEHLTAIAEGLLEIEKGDPKRQAEVVENVFRESHSLKGAARSVNLGEIVSVCQAMENVFSAFKRKGADPSPDTLDLLHRAVDFTRALALRGEQAPSGMPGGRDLIVELDRAVARGGKSGPQKGKAEETRRPTPESAVPPAPGVTQAGTIRISVSKLDSLLFKAEEMLSAKLAFGERVEELKELKEVFNQWKKGARSHRRPSDDLAQSVEPILTKLTHAAELDRRSMGTLVDSLLADMKKTLMLPFSSLLEGFPGFVRNLSREAGKEVELTIRGGEIEIDRRVLEEVKDPLIHLVRNCIDHGVEMPHDRERKGKPRFGSIKIIISSRDSRIEIAVSDDGAGINAARVRAAAEKDGVISCEEGVKLGEKEALLLVFRSGVTTSPIVTDISGRGLGLAIVREKVEKLGGGVEIESQPDEGSTIRLLVPLTLATFRGVLVRVDGQQFILPSTSVQRVTRVRKDAVRTVENRETVVLDGQAASLVRLADVLEMKPGIGREDPSDPFIQVVVLGSAPHRMVFQVDEVLHEQEVLVKPLGKQLSRVRNVSGATVLGSGKVIPILNVADLTKSAVKASPSYGGSDIALTEKKVRILVAEDSITARTLLKGILETAGYDVAVAVDGMDAFSVLAKGGYDLLVSDVDMPRMNGFDLTAKVRADRRLSDLPIVLVTALESMEDRERGVDAGANAYIVKSSFDQSNLLEVVKRLV